MYAVDSNKKAGFRNFAYLSCNETLKREENLEAL
jgi:hypothetical protein